MYISYNFLSNISTKNYRHRLQFDEVITKTTRSTFTQSQCIFTSRLNAANTIIAITKFASIIASRKKWIKLRNGFASYIFFARFAVYFHRICRQKKDICVSKHVLECRLLHFNSVKLLKSGRRHKVNVVDDFFSRAAVHICL